jgi:hypothetical protein
MWKAIYDSPLHHPLACWLATSGLLLWAANRARLPGRARAWLWLFGLCILADATLTGAWSPLPAEHPASQPLAIAFVVAGDWRFFVWGTLLASDGPPWRAWLTGLGWALIVPLLHGAAIRAWPSAMSDLRVVYLAYELGLAAVVGVWWWRQRRRACPQQRAIGSLASFELLQYLGWATADIVILAGSDLGHGLRLVPNLMYYAGFLAFAVIRCAPVASLTPAPPEDT